MRGERGSGGADALHAHVRDAEGQHVLDAGLYKELILEVSAMCPDLAVQITTEAVGRYSAQEQYDVVAAVEPEAVSVALREMAPEGDELDLARRFYHEAKDAGRAVQHILYAPEDVARLDLLMDKGVVPSGYGSQLYVLGRYAKDQESDPRDLLGFLAARDAASHIAQDNPFMLCAFGRAETACGALAFGMVVMPALALRIVCGMALASLHKTMRSALRWLLIFAVKWDMRALFPEVRC